MAFNELFSLVGGGVNTDDANATASQILSGYTAYVKGKKVTGNIPSQGAQTITPGTSDKTIASGKYLSGTQTIKGDSNLVAGNIKAGTSIFGISGTFTSDANATAANILSGKTAYVNGNKVTGRITSQGAQTITPSTTNKTISSGKYLSGTQTIKGDANLKSENIKSGVSIFGVSGSFSGSSDEKITAFYPVKPNDWPYDMAFVITGTGESTLYSVQCLSSICSNPIITSTSVSFPEFTFNGTYAPHPKLTITCIGSGGACTVNFENPSGYITPSSATIMPGNTQTFETEWSPFKADIRFSFSFAPGTTFMVFGAVTQPITI